MGKGIHTCSICVSGSCTCPPLAWNHPPTPPIPPGQKGWGLCLSVHYSGHLFQISILKILLELGRWECFSAVNIFAISKLTIFLKNLYFRDTEDKLEESQKMLMEKEYNLQTLKEDYRKMKHDLIGWSKQGKRWQITCIFVFNSEILTIYIFAVE